MKTAPSGAVFVCSFAGRSAALLVQRRLHRLARGRTMLRVLQREVHGRLDQADVRTTVKTPALEVVGIDMAAVLDRRGDRVGQLDLAAGTAAGGLQLLEDAAGQDV